MGAYTAGAILSIAFAQAEPIADGNVVRVLARLEALAGAADDARLTATVWQRAGELVRADDGADAGDFNQAMMELGAMVCTPRAPECGRCPLLRLCRAHAGSDAGEGASVERFPAPKTKKPPRPVDAVTLVLERAQTLLLVRRPPTGLWGGLWEPPTRPLERGEAADAAAAQTTAARLGLDLADIRPLGQFEHVLTHRRMQFHAFAARARGRVRLDGAGYDAHRWQARDGVAELGVAAWTRRLLQPQPITEPV